MRYVLALLVLIAAPAAADDPAQLSDGAECQAFIPSSVLKDTPRGTATISYRVLADGSVAEPTVKRSSGSGELDNAARTCVAAWQYRPATRQGQAVDFDLTTKIAMLTPKPHVCVLRGTTWDKVRPLKGITRVKFTIDESGRTDAISVAQTSGEAELDAASTECVSRWRYLPAERDGKAVVVPWDVDIAWNTESRPERFTDMTKCVRDIVLKPEDLVAAQKPTQLSYTVIGGTVFDLQADQASGNKRLDNLALRCASRTRFRETVVMGASPGYRASESINWKAVLRPAP